MLITALSGLCVLLLIAAAFGAGGAWARRRYGPSAVLALWVGVAVVLAVAGTARSAALERGMRYQPSVHHPAWMFGLFAVLLLLALAPGAALLARRAWTARAAALGSALLMLPGLLLAAVVGLALDLGGVNFLPPR